MLFKQNIGSRACREDKGLPALEDIEDRAGCMESNSNRVHHEADLEFYDSIA